MYPLLLRVVTAALLLLLLLLLLHDSKPFAAAVTSTARCRKQVACQICSLKRHCKPPPPQMADTPAAAPSATAGTQPARH
jgi:hypothetical protein